MPPSTATRPCLVPLQKLELEGKGAPLDKILVPNPRRFVLFPIKYAQVRGYAGYWRGAPTAERPLPPRGRRARCHALSPVQVWEMYKKAVASHWTAEEIDLAHDRKVRGDVAWTAAPLWPEPRPPPRLPLAAGLGEAHC